MKKKCGNCGVVNWPDAEECVRCSSNLSAQYMSASPTRQARVEISTPPKAASRSSLYSFIAFLLLVGSGFGFYKVYVATQEALAAPEKERVEIEKKKEKDEETYKKSRENARYLRENCIFIEDPKAEDFQQYRCR